MDPPWAIGDTEVVDAVNVDWYQTRLGVKRNGEATVTVSFSSGGPMTNVMSLYRHVPGTNEGAAELWITDDQTAGARKLARMAGATTFAEVTKKDPMTAAAPFADVCSTSTNAKHVMAYESAVDRLHLWDGATMRRAGLGAPTGNAVADQGGGAYAAVIRYYRTRWTEQVGGITVRRSEPSPISTFTPSGGGTAARVSRSAAPAEGETHWELEASTDGVTFYRIATIVIATTFYDDSAATTTYNLSPLSQLTGTYTVQKSYRFIAADQNRLLGFGSFTATDKQSRIEYSAVLGSLDVGDIERVDTTVGWYADLDEADSGVPTGLGGPCNGAFLAFKERQTWLGTPTGNVDRPYNWAAISKSVGALSQQSIVRGEDESGNPAIYWMSLRGAYRWGVRGLEYIGYGVEDLLLGPSDTIRLVTLALGPLAHSCYYQDKRQVWFWVAVNSNPSAVPYALLKYDIASGGWSRSPTVTDTTLSMAWCATLFANTLGATMSKDLKPYISTASLGGTATLFKADTGVASTRAYIVTKAIEPGGPGRTGEVGEAVLLAAVSAGVTITVSVSGDFGSQSMSGTALLTAIGAETRVQVPVIGSALSEIAFVQYTIGDAAAVATAWNLDRVVVPIGPHQAVSG